MLEIVPCREPRILMTESQHPGARAPITVSYRQMLGLGLLLLLFFFACQKPQFKKERFLPYS